MVVELAIMHWEQPVATHKKHVEPVREPDKGTSHKRGGPVSEYGGPGTIHGGAPSGNGRVGLLPPALGSGGDPGQRSPGSTARVSKGAPAAGGREPGSLSPEEEVLEHVPSMAIVTAAAEPDPHPLLFPPPSSADATLI